MARQPRTLHGMTAAITGGARGIGRATAQAFVRHGMKVAIGDLDLQAARQTASELGPGAAAFQLDVTDRDSFAAFLDGAEQHLGLLDVLVNNAGIMQIGRFLEEDDATARRQIDINLHGVIYGCKLALERMVPRDNGTVVNIASQAGKFGAPGGATYSATKHAVVGLTEAIRGELVIEGSHVEMAYVMPSVVNTELGAGTAQTRGVEKIEPQDVADAIVECLQYGIVDVWVPKKVKTINRLITLMPRRGSEAVGRLIKADKVLYEFDPAARHDYELRASRSEPALDPGDAQQQIEQRSSAT
ncbi:MAG TPA: SDR family oxidoreductase [Solirubrobacteraceae bacterium]|nr:SDR family oxidoreductase [Solirubrobacteraceae bacterium]